jgi:hypothetical protein
MGMRIRWYAFAAALLCLLAVGPVLNANTIGTFSLGGDPNQIFRLENVGPYPGTLTGSNAIDFFCLDFTLTATFGGRYDGTVAIPTSEAEKEAAFLASYAIYKGSPSSTPSEVNVVEGPISFAIWQIMGTLGTAAPDPAAQPYIQTAQYAYSHNLIPQSYLNSVLIFEASDNRIQRFITAIPDNAMVSSTLSSEVSEPGTTALLGGALVLLAMCSRTVLQSRDPG